MSIWLPKGIYNNIPIALIVIGSLGIMVSGTALSWGLGALLIVWGLWLRWERAQYRTMTVWPTVQDRKKTETGRK